MGHDLGLGGPRRRHTQPVRAVAAMVALALVGGLMTVSAPAPPAGAVSSVEFEGPGFSDCQNAILFRGFPTCRPISIVRQVTVNGAAAADGVQLRVGDVVGVEVLVNPGVLHDAMYQETGDGMWSSRTSLRGSIDVALPSFAAGVLSAPFQVRMARSDLGDRGSGPDVSCAAQAGEEAARSDAERAVTPNLAAVGNTGMRAVTTATNISFQWTKLAVDRCVGIVSNGGVYAGFTAKFTQTVLTKPIGTPSGTWSVGPVTLTGTSRSQTWGTTLRQRANVFGYQQPGPPTGVAVSIDHDRRVAKVVWSPPVSDGGSPILHYEVRVAEAGMPDVLYEVAASSRSTVMALLPLRTYRVSVRAVNVAGSGPWADSGEITPIYRPGAPSGVVATAGDGRAQVAWTPPTDPRTSSVTGYIVYPFRGDQALTPIEVGAAARNLEVPSLDNGATYSFEVAARNEVGVGDRSPRSDLVVPTAGQQAPGVPTGLVATVKNRVVDIGWAPPASDGGAPVQGYRVIVRSGATVVADVGHAATDRSHRSLVPNGTPVTVEVRARNTIGTGAAATASPGTPRGWMPFADASAFVRQQYVDFAGRQPTASELAQWSTTIRGGGEGTDLVEALAAGTYWDGTLAPIVRLYRALYLRDPETSGLQYWEGELRSRRRTLSAMADFVARSPEFRALYGSLGNTAFVDKVYQLVLGRSASAADRAYWTGELAKGQPRGKMVLLFSSSPEYKAKSAVRVKAVLLRYGLYRKVGTKAEVDGVVFGLALNPIDDVIALLLADPTYADRFRR